MTISGHFYDINNSRVDVTITTQGVGNNITIGENGLFFSGDPVKISQDADDTTTALIETSCEIGLVAENYMGDYLYAPNERSISVTVTRGNDTLFSGYVMPMSFSQPFANPLEPFTVNCIDSISALQYRKYLDANDSNYDTVKSTASTCRSFKSIIISMFPQNTPIYFDNSKGLDAQHLDTMLDDVAVNEMIFLGDEVDDVVTKEEALESMLRYLDLHIMQRGGDILIFDWSTLRSGNTSWTDLRNGTQVTFSPSDTTLTSAMHAAADTNISVGDCYNQVKLKCKTDDGNELIVNPLDGDTLTSRWSNKQLYMREWIGKTVAYGSDLNFTDEVDFYNFTLGNLGRNTQNYRGNDWYLRVMESPLWKFVANHNNGTWLQDQFEVDANGTPVNQHNVAKYIWQHNLRPCIFQFGSIEFSPADNEPVGKISMSNYLYISVNGATGSRYTLDVNATNPSIEYTGAAGANLTPTDEETTNYLVFSGSLTLQPRVDAISYTDLCNWTPSPTDLSIWLTMPPTGPNNSNHYDKRYYTRKYYNIEYPTDTPDESDYLEYNLQPPVSGSIQTLKYEYSRDFRTADLVTKLEVLECELIIGNKRLIERRIDADGNSVFEWVTIGQEPSVTEGGVTYPITTFSLGVNPKINDFIIGTEFNLQNTVTVAMNLDVEGTAIPIHKSDNVSGAVIFRILGPINSLWNVVTRRHATWFRTETFTAQDEPVLEYVQNIIIKDFSVTVHSDNALNDVIEDKDLIYISERTDDYVNLLELDEFKIITQPTSAEAAALSIKNAPFSNAAMITADGTPLRQIYKASTQESAKPEQHYVDAYYTEYSKPRVEMTTTLHGDDVDRLGTYDSTPLARSFCITTTEHDVRYDRVTCNMKEIPPTPTPTP